MNDDDFGIRWTGYLSTPASGTYQLGAIGMNALEFYFDGKPLFQFNNIHERAYQYAPVQLEAGKLYPIFPAKLFCRYKYDTAKYLTNVKCPVLIIHSPQDDIIPYSMGLKLFEIAKEPKKFIEISGSHNEGASESNVYEQGILNWLKSL